MLRWNSSLRESAEINVWCRARTASALPRARARRREGIAQAPRGYPARARETRTGLSSVVAMANGAMASSFSTASREPCVGFGVFAERATRVTARRARAPLAALGGLGGASVRREASSAAWRKGGLRSKARRTVDRRAVVVPRARAGDTSGSKWFRGLGTGSRNDEDPIPGALHQTRGLHERLADLAGGSSKPTAGADVVKSDESDWEHWQEVIDKADAEDQILTALEVRPSSSIVSFSGTSRS